MRWVAWTPTGYYMASPGGEDLIGWHVNRGWDQAPDFFPAARFREKFNRPDIVRRVLDTLDEATAVREANAAAHVKDDKPVAAVLPPVIKLVNPAPGARFSGDSVEVVYELRSPSGAPVDRVEVLLDGRPVQTRGLQEVQDSPPGVQRLSVPVPSRDVELSLIAHARDLFSERASVRLFYAGAAAPAAEEVALKPKLYALVVGVSDYQNPELRLGLAAKDAQDFARALEAQSGGLYAKIETKVLVDKAASRDGVLDGLEWLEKQVTSRDIGVIFLAGHGMLDEKQMFWFLPADADANTVRRRGVSQDELRRTLRALAGKALFFVDACHAAGAAEGTLTRGQVDINSVLSDFRAAENGVITFASSQGRELSQENSAWGNGAFTKALIEGFGQGRADLLHKGTITLSELDAYVVERVKDLTGGRQHPVMARPATVSDFAFALVK
jgi:hypothetical protein